MKIFKIENFQVQKFQYFNSFNPLGAWRSEGRKSSDFYCKRYILVCKSTSFAPFCLKVLRRFDPQSGGGSEKVTRGSHRNDVSLLTQGFNYRSACDSLRSLQCSVKAKFEQQ